MIPPAVNGRTHDAPAPAADPSDTKILYTIIGGIICAFMIGILLLVAALVTDWS